MLTSHRNDSNISPGIWLPGISYKHKSKCMQVYMFVFVYLVHKTSNMLAHDISRRIIVAENLSKLLLVTKVLKHMITSIQLFLSGTILLNYSTRILNGCKRIDLSSCISLCYEFLSIMLDLLLFININNYIYYNFISNYF